MTMIKKQKSVLVAEDDDKLNVVEWIQGKAKLKEGLAFPPDFLKREIVFTPKPPKVETESDIVRKVKSERTYAKAKGVPTKVDPKDFKAKKSQKAKKTVGPVIRVLVDDFGHKPGSLAATKSSGLKDGMSVAEYKAIDLEIGKGWQSGHLKNMVRRGFVKIEG